MIFKPWVQRNFGMQPVKCALAKIDMPYREDMSPEVFLTFQNWGRWTQFDLGVFLWDFVGSNYQTRLPRKDRKSHQLAIPKKALWITRVSKMIFNKMISPWSLKAPPRKNGPGPNLPPKKEIATSLATMMGSLNRADIVNLQWGPVSR